MKKILILLVISFSVNASYIPKSKIGKDTEGLTMYSKKAMCESVYSEVCTKIPRGYVPNDSEDSMFGIVVNENKKAARIAAEELAESNEATDISQIKALLNGIEDPKARRAIRKLFKKIYGE